MIRHKGEKATLVVQWRAIYGWVLSVCEVCRHYVITASNCIWVVIPGHISMLSLFGVKQIKWMQKRENVMNIVMFGSRKEGRKKMVSLGNK
jgi:hypothetical protein